MFAATKITSAIVLAATLVTGANAAQTVQDPRISEFCGQTHQNELASPEEVRANPAGFYVEPTGEQIGASDPRLVFTNQETAYLCTRPVGHPMMHHAEALEAQGKRTVRFLFVPNDKLYPSGGNR